MKSNDGLARNRPRRHPTEPPPQKRTALTPLANERVKLGIKSVLGAALIYYVLNSKMIDFSSVRSILVQPANLMAAFLFLTFGAASTAFRWYLLARAQGLQIPFRAAFEMTMIGAFFNTFMPGAVGGDLVKAWYAAGSAPGKRTSAVFTVLLDRVIGLSVFFLYAGVTLLFYTSWLTTRPQLQSVALFVWTFSALSTIAALVFFSPWFWQLAWFKSLLDLVRRQAMLKKIVDAAILYRHHLVTITAALAISAASIFVMTNLYIWMGSALAIPMQTPQYYFAIPLALVASAVPILPGGLGVGQLAFYTLFLWMGVPNPQQGGSLCTVVQVYTILFNCLGAFFYLRFRRHEPVDLSNGVAPQMPVR